MVYSMLCRVLGVLLVAVGLLMLASFFRSLLPGAAPAFAVPIGPNGMYFVAFTGCALVGWGGSLFAAVRGARVLQLPNRQRELSGYLAGSH